MSKEDQAAFDTLETRLKTILPPEYQDTYEEVQPVSMGSAGLTYAADGRVAWNEIWKTFCDLAMAAGLRIKGSCWNPVRRKRSQRRPGGTGKWWKRYAVAFI